MKIVSVYARLYAEAFTKALEGIAKSPWTLLLPVMLLALSLLTASLLSGLDQVGGFLMLLVFDALASCYLYFVGEVVASSRATLLEFRKSIGAYFFAIMGVNFVLYILRLFLGYALGTNPQGGVISSALTLGALILLNVVPEILYLRSPPGSIATLQASIHFVQEHWIEWFIPNLVFFAIFYALAPLLLSAGLLGGLVFALAGGALLHLFMVFRGHLFRALDGSSHRQRMFKYRGPS